MMPLATSEELITCLKVRSSKKRRRTSPAEYGAKATVSFFDTVAVVSIRHINDYSMQEINGLWTTKEENAVNRAECMAICAIMAANGRNYLLPEEEVHTGSCSRGLEYRTREAFDERRARKTDAQMAVLWEQQSQRDRNEVNEKMIACAYRCHTVLSQEAAHQMGLQDERDCA
jgi:hypothetical protein